MKPTLKRLTAFLLVLALTLSSIPVAFAEGTEEAAGITSEGTTITHTPEITDKPGTLQIVDVTNPSEQEEITDNRAEEDEIAAPDIIDDSVPIDSDAPNINDGISLMSIFNCQAIDWATIWVNTDEYSSIAGKTNRFIYYQFPSGTSRSRNNIGVKAVKMNGVWTPAYCLEPGIAQSSYYTEDDMTKSQFINGSAAPSTLSAQQIEAMCIAVMFGQHVLPQSATYELLSNMVATQIIVWEIAVGWRNPYPPYTRTNDGFIRRFKNVGSTWPEATSSYIKVGGRLKTIVTSYDAIAAKLESFSAAIPSFTSGNRYSAPTIDLRPDGTGKYTATLYDANGVLSGYTFTNTSDLSFQKSGNTLTVTANKKLTDYVVAPYKNMPDLENHTFYVWYNGSYQVMLGTASDPATAPFSAFFRVNTVDPTGSVKLVKTTNTGKNLSGWKIGLYTDSACTKPVSGSPFTTGSDGTVTVNNLTAGTLYAKELSVDDSYWKCDTTVHTITVTAGQTVTSTWKNTEYGLGKFRKVTNTGEGLSGWQTTLYSDEACTKAVSTCTLGAAGTGSVYLEPGIYYAKETGDANNRFGSFYWSCDATAHRMEIKGHTESEVVFTNTVSGNLQITKTMPSGGSVAGWQFQIKDASGKAVNGSPFETDNTGHILVSGLLPGSYTVEELIPKNSPYTCAGESSVSVTVVAEETCKVSFANVLHSGKICLQKNDTLGQPLAGAKFLLEWSENGTTWKPIAYSNTDYATKGGCSNTSLKDGCLTTGEDGKLEWGNLHPLLQYRLTETEAPNGFNLLTDSAYEGTLPAEFGAALYVEVVNARTFTLPETGSSALCIINTLSMLTMAAGILASGYVLRKKERED